MFSERFERLQDAMEQQNIDVAMLSLGADMPWLTGYRPMPLERLTMMVVVKGGPATMFVPGLEVARVTERNELFKIVGWGETDNPVKLVADAAGTANRVALGDQTWSKFLVELQALMPNTKWSNASQLVGPLRAVKEQHEIERLQVAATSVDKIAASLQSGEIPLIGRTEAEVSAELGERILADNHAKVNFAIVAAGENSASPHHHPGSRIIKANEVVLCDFGGTTAEAEGEPGYCSDITRCVYTGTPPTEFSEAYDALQQAQAAATQAAVVGASAAAVDGVARSALDNAGLGQWFVHRLGHGIGVEAHEDPYLAANNPKPLVAGNAFSIEPGFYIDDKWGARLEDIVLATDAGPRSLNNADRSLAVVEA